jgi:hypothetical protein
LSRHRNIRLSRSRAIVIAAAGALSVATAASAAAATWSQGSQGHAAGPDGPAKVTGTAAGAPRLAVADQLARPIAEAETRQSSATVAQHAFQLRLTQTRDAIAQRQVATNLAARKAAAAAQARTAAAQARTAAAQARTAAAQARTAAAQTRAAAQPGQTASATVPAGSGSPRQIAQAMLASFGWAPSQFSCLDPLWEHESSWSVSAANPGSGAFGIPQALPGSRMASAGPDWQTSATTQIKWGLQYIKGTYGSPCAAWAHEEATSWY